ncbi:helix-turn-helix domain-containing protein [Erythrobacter sp. YT30]|uniref:winged helix-turn-helix transcriptional regulator n=1 Tax=Erythrobacter sp. YT30 TaxID=1735012 RepID=UPI00076BE18A|nr:helix-turn-helix domain-containing protein [Erythrobacter sp. YT30]KWV91052.1 transcriptional regulator [Erythrobacter sp. YT30]
MARKKPYNDGCATAHALDLIGERWALLVVRELVPGPKRFSDLKAALPGISTNILTTRLSELEAGHILVRRQLPPPAASQVYELTEWGADLEPLIKDIGRWAARSPSLEPGKPMSAASVLLSFRTMFSPELAGDAEISLSLIFEGVPHFARIAGGKLTAETGEIDSPDVAVEGDPNLLAGMVYGGMPIEEAERGGLLIVGDKEVLQRFATYFPLPKKAEFTA